jgi:hypothetical protein
MMGEKLSNPKNGKAETAREANGQPSAEKILWNRRLRLWLQNVFDSATIDRQCGEENHPTNARRGWAWHPTFSIP